MKRLALVLLVVAALAGASASWSRLAATSAQGVLTPISSEGSSYFYTLRLSNTGDQSIECMRFTVAQGAAFASVTQNVPGAQPTAIPGQGFSANLSQQPLVPNDSITWSFTTNGPYPANTGGTLAVSPDCVQDFAGTVTGPAPAPPTTTTTKTVTTVQNCQCEKLTASIKAPDIYTASAQLVGKGTGLARIGALVTWTMTCSTGRGKCGGSITPLPPPMSDAKVETFVPSTFVPKTGPYEGKRIYVKGKPLAPAIACTGPCNASTTGRFFLEIDSARDLLPGRRGGKTLVLRFAVKCTTASTQEIKLVFKTDGSLDKTKSTLAK